MSRADVTAMPSALAQAVGVKLTISAESAFGDRKHQGGGDGVRCIPSDISKWAWMLLRHTSTPRTIRPSRKPPMPDASRYRHSRIPN